MTGAPRVHVTGADGLEVVRAGGAWRAEENTRLRVRIEGGPWELALNGRPVLWDPRLPGAEIATPFAVGRMTLTLAGGDRVHEVPFDVTPADAKLGADLWEHLLADLERWLPGVAAGVEGPAQGGLAFDGLDVASAVEAVLPLIPAFEQSIARVLEAPRERTVTELRDRPLHRARQATGPTLAWISRHPREAAWLRPETDSSVAGPPPMLPLPLSFETLDHPANRHLVWLIRRVAARLRAAATTLDKALCSDLNDTRTWRDARCEALRIAASRLLRLERNGPLRDVPAAPATEAALMVLLDAPIYARAHRLGRRILRSGLASGQAPEVATRPSYHLYELWCFFAVQQAVASELGDGWTWGLKNAAKLLDLGSTGAGARFEGSGPGGERVRVLFNPRFPSRLRFDGESPPEKRHSLTRERRPDVVVTWRDGDERRWVALDAKYRVGSAALADAFASAHIYRDSLRWPGLGGQPAVGALLAPRCEKPTTAWFADWFLERHQVGAIELAPGAPLDAVGRRLLFFLRNEGMVDD